MEPYQLVFRGRRVARDRSLIMAIINRTPDSFYDHGSTFAESDAKAAIQAALDEGADVIDIGGVPASPGPDVSVSEEIDRVVPTIEWTRATFPDAVISVDTYRHEVADQVCRAGADLLNDNWANCDGGMLEIAAKYECGYVCAHTGGLAPRTDPHRPSYDDVVASVIADTVQLAEQAVACGVPRAGVMIDPAIDFRKNTWHSLDILQRMPELIDTGWPVLMAMSNKGVVGETLDVELGDRLTGTLAASALAAQAGAAMFRVHQVRETRHTLEMVASISGQRPAARVVRYLG